MRQLIVIGIILLLSAACQQESVSEELIPTVFIPPSATFTPSITPSRTPTPTITPTATPVHSPTATVSATFTPPPSKTPSPTRTGTPTRTFTPMPSPTLLPDTFIFGQSAGGRDLVAHRIGTGHTFIFIVGGIHAGFEANTVDLAQELLDHFRRTPGDILPEIGLILVPSLNPDGLARGEIVEGRFNGNMVDLNRNWGCGWSEDAEWRLGYTDPGTEPFSEPETQALGALAEKLQPAAVIFYHGAVDGVFAGDCEGDGISLQLAEIYGEASGYPYGEEFTEYRLTGTAPNWFESLGIPSVDVELSTTTGTEFDRNLRGVLATQTWIVRRQRARE